MPRKTISRSATKRIAELQATHTRCVVKSLRDDFEAKDCDPRSAWDALARYRNARLYDDGDHLTVHVHSNLWFVLRVGVPDNEEGDESQAAQRLTEMRQIAQHCDLYPRPARSSAVRRLTSYVAQLADGPITREIARRLDLPASNRLSTVRELIAAELIASEEARRVKAAHALTVRVEDEPSVQAGRHAPRTAAMIEAAKTEATVGEDAPWLAARAAAAAATAEAALADMAAHGLKLAIDADCPGCGWAERNYDPATGLFGCSRCEFESYGRDGDPESTGVECQHCGWGITLSGDTWRDERGDPGCGANRGGHSPEQDDEPAEGCGCTDEHQCDTAQVASAVVEALDALDAEEEPAADPIVDAAFRQAEAANVAAGGRPINIVFAPQDAKDEPDFAALVPDADTRASWVEAAAGDEYAAMLCATAAIATALAQDVYEQVKAGVMPPEAVAKAAQQRDDCRSDVLQYYGADLGDQSPGVLRVVGFRV